MSKSKNIIGPGKDSRLVELIEGEIVTKKHWAFMVRGTDEANAYVKNAEGKPYNPNNGLQVRIYNAVKI